MKRKRAKTVEELHAGAMKALKEAVEKALEQHFLAGVPAAIWRDGKVVYIPGRRRVKRRRHSAALKNKK